jgi:hypothetical protein
MDVNFGPKVPNRVIIIRAGAKVLRIASNSIQDAVWEPAQDIPDDRFFDSSLLKIIPYHSECNRLQARLITRFTSNHSSASILYCGKIAHILGHLPFKEDQTAHYSPQLVGLCAWRSNASLSSKKLKGWRSTTDVIVYSV